MITRRNKLDLVREARLADSFFIDVDCRRAIRDTSLELVDNLKRIDRCLSSPLVALEVSFRKDVEVHVELNAFAM